MILSQRIAALLEEMLEAQGGEMTIVRNELAERMGCVPSQINYVITSRFTPQRGYLVESRRGGGGYIRIRKVTMYPKEELLRFYHAASAGMDPREARFFLGDLVAKKALTPREGRLLSAALSDTALAPLDRASRDLLRGEIFRTVILQMLSESEETL